MKTVLVALSLAFVFAAGSVATAAVGWRVFASATDKGEYGTLASVSASVQNPNALGVRVNGTSGPFEVTWYISCEGVTRPALGKIVALSVPAAAKCSVNAMGDGDKAGSIRVELLRR